MTNYSTQVLGSHLIIRREDGGPVQCGWDTLQEIKNEMLGVDVCAVEVFPPQDELVDEANRRHLWVIDDNSVPSLIRRSS